MTVADDGQGSSAAIDDDLSDIVDVVVEMGRDPQPAVTQAPSPLPAMTVETRLPGHLQGLADRARDYVEAASSANTRRAYASDWKHFAGWCRRQGVEMLPPDPQTVGLYITAFAAATGRDKKMVSTIERRLSSLSWNFSQRGQPLDRKDRHIATVMAGISNKHASPSLFGGSRSSVFELFLTSPNPSRGLASLRDQPCRPSQYGVRRMK